MIFFHFHLCLFPSHDRCCPENQLAAAIGQQQQQPVKAYVVSGDVTTAQSLDRNIVEEASIGGSERRSPTDIMFGRG